MLKKRWSVATEKKLRVTLSQISEEARAAGTVPGAPVIPASVPGGEECVAV